MARIAAVLLLAALPGVPASAQDLTVLIQPPPAADDPRTIRDIAMLRGLQASRTPDGVRAAQADVDESAFLFQSVLGPGFDARRLPRTADLMARAGEAASAAMNRAKAVWNRPRPSSVAPHLRPCLPVPATSSYPNGHAVLGMVYAGLLGRMLPEHRAALFARAREYAEHREACGLHFPGGYRGRLRRRRGHWHRLPCPGAGRHRPDRAAPRPGPARRPARAADGCA